MEEQKSKKILIKVKVEVLEAFKECVLDILGDPARKTIPNEFFSKAMKQYVIVQHQQLKTKFLEIHKNLELNDEQFDALSFKEQLQIIRNYYKELAP